MTDKATQDSIKAGYETRDADVRTVVFWVVLLTAVVVASFFIVQLTFRHITVRQSAQDTAPSPLAVANPIPPTPRLVVNGKTALAALRLVENERLTTVAWVDQSAGIARIPISDAIEIVAANGLPTWPAIETTNGDEQP